MIHQPLGGAQGQQTDIEIQVHICLFSHPFVTNPETVMYAMQPSIEHTSQWFIAQLVMFLVSIKLSPNNLIHLLLFPSLRIWSYCWPFQLTKICNLFFERKSMLFTSSSFFLVEISLSIFVSSHMDYLDLSSILNIFTALDFLPPIASFSIDCLEVSENFR
jgi:hypothetical protein